jgi:hypothetical protein
VVALAQVVMVSPRLSLSASVVAPLNWLALGDASEHRAAAGHGVERFIGARSRIGGHSEGAGQRLRHALEVGLDGGCSLAQRRDHHVGRQLALLAQSLQRTDGHAQAVGQLLHEVGRVFQQAAQFVAGQLAGAQRLAELRHCAGALCRAGAADLHGHAQQLGDAQRVRLRAAHLLDGRVQAREHRGAGLDAGLRARADALQLCHRGAGLHTCGQQAGVVCHLRRLHQGQGRGVQLDCLRDGVERGRHLVGLALDRAPLVDQLGGVGGDVVVN